MAEYPYKWFFYDCLWLEDKIVFPDSNCNAICETDIKTGRTQIVCTANEDEERLLFHGIYKWKDYLVLPARMARPALHLFDLKRREWSSILLEDGRKEWLNFREEAVFEYNEYLYIFPFPLIVLKVNVEKKCIDYIFYPDMEPNDDIRGEIVLKKNTIYIPVKHGRKIHKFDLALEQWEIIEVNTDLKGIDTLCYDGGQFWISGIGKMICSWNEEENISISYHDFPQGFDKLGTIDECAVRKGEDGWWFGRSFLYGKSVYFVPNDANMLVEFDTEKKEMKELPIEGEEETKQSLQQMGRYSTIKYMGAKQKDNFLLLLSNRNKNLILLDLEKKETRATELEIRAEDELGKIILSRQKISEGVVNLGVWIKYVTHMGEQDKEQAQEKQMGKRIYDAIR